LFIIIQSKKLKQQKGEKKMDTSAQKEKEEEKSCT